MATANDSTKPPASIKGSKDGDFSTDSGKSTRTSNQTANIVTNIAKKSTSTSPPKKSSEVSSVKRPSSSGEGLGTNLPNPGRMLRSPYTLSQGRSENSFAPQHSLRNFESDVNVLLKDERQGQARPSDGPKPQSHKQTAPDQSLHEQLEDHKKTAPNSSLREELEAHKKTAPNSSLREELEAHNKTTPNPSLHEELEGHKQTAQYNELKSASQLTIPNVQRFDHEHGYDKSFKHEFTTTGQTNSFPPVRKADKDNPISGMDEQRNLEH